jgi:hypothetical protein
VGAARGLGHFLQLRPRQPLPPGGLELHLASSKVDTRSERVIGQVTVNDQNQRR